MPSMFASLETQSSGDLQGEPLKSRSICEFFKELHTQVQVSAWKHHTRCESDRVDGVSLFGLIRRYRWPRLCGGLTLFISGDPDLEACGTVCECKSSCRRIV